MRKEETTINIYIFIGLIFLIIFINLGFFNYAEATRLYLDSVEKEYYPGQTFIVNLRIDTEGDCINVVEGNLSFTNNLLEVMDFSRGESILTLWLKEPTINQESGLISFIGGVPGSYCGRIMGDPGLSNLLGQLICRIPGLVVGETKEKTPAIKFLDSSRVFLNDGLGTKTETKNENISFKILAEGTIANDEWREELLKDNVPPEPFEIEIYQDPNIFEGKYFIVFNTSDKQTGIDHYEISEEKSAGGEQWEVASSPYLLRDQDLLSIIKVRAVDKAGNERIIEYLSGYLPPKNSLFYWKIIITVSLTIISLYIILKRKLLRVTKNDK